MRPDWLDFGGRLPLLFAVNFCRLRQGLFTMNLHFAADTLECEFLISCPFIYFCCLVIWSCWEYKISNRLVLGFASRTSAPEMLLFVLLNPLHPGSSADSSLESRRVHPPQPWTHSAIKKLFLCLLIHDLIKVLPDQRFKSRNTAADLSTMDG